MARLLVACFVATVLLGCPSPEGVTGPEGPQGPSGPTGSTGPQGPQGPQGQVLVLDGGAVVGPAGPRGASVVMSILPAGTLCATGGVRLTLEDGGSPQLVCNGGAGAQGPTGLTGPAGAAGVTGATGAAGAAGATGPAGTSVTVTSVAAGDANCPYGGSRFTVASASAWACSGAPGPMGPPGGSGGGGGSSSSGFALAGNEGFSLAGFTTASYTGDLGGIVGAHAKCAAQFPGAHLCTSREYEVLGSAAPLPTGGAWADNARYISTSTPSASPRDREGGYTCGAWRATSGAYSGALDVYGDFITTTASAACGVAKPLACCRSPHLSWFRGFTTAAFNGDLGGIQGAHAKCATEYAGSHLCTSREYEQAGSAAPVPAAGAWADNARYISSSTPSATPRDREGGYTCGNWRLTSGSYSGALDVYGAFLTTTATAGCSVVRPLACCAN